MISTCIASKALCKENKEISVRLVLPMDEKEIWSCIEKTEMSSLDDCVILNAFSDINKVDDFLKKISLLNEDIFNLNYFAGLLETMNKAEKEKFCNELKFYGIGSLGEAVQLFRNREAYESLRKVDE